MLVSLDSEFQLVERLHQDDHAMLYRARRVSTGELLLIKTFPMDYPSPQQVAQLKQEYEMARRAASPGVLAPVGWEQHRHTWLLLFEDVEARLLEDVLARGKIALTHFFDIALPLAEAVSHLHRKNVIHRDLRPCHLFVNPLNQSVKLTNFSSATRLAGEWAESTSPLGTGMEHRGRYASPEQTGRINRSADHRSDLYALGVILYEMLTGRLPFEAEDSATLIHQLLTQEAVPPSLLDPRLPSVLSDVVLKCLEKNPEDRYQSAFGLLHDLKTCRDQWREQGEIADFALGSADRSEQFSIAKSLYGRERDLERMSEAFERTRFGGSKGVLVYGPSGVGKSSLVREMKQLVRQEQATFLESKFEANKRPAPYEGFLQALKQWVMQIVANGEGSIAHWGEQMTRTLGPMAGVLVEALPELQLILGVQPEVPALPAQETRNRFLLAVLQWLSLLPTTQHPLVLFLDDLQWADPASLHLLSLLQTERPIPHLLLIGSYRIEGEEDVPLRAPLEIRVMPFTADEVRRLLQDTLRSSAERVAALAEVVTQKTGGSPLLVKQFVQSLPTKGLLALDARTGEWRWDIEAISALEVTESQVDFLLSSFRQFPERNRQLLGAAACIGTTFRVELLSHVLGEEPSLVAVDLLPLMEERLIEPFHGRYRFAHDRIQQAAYALLTEEERKRTHLKLGRWLQGNQAGRAADESQSLYEQVHHFNHALELLEAPAEREDVARLHAMVAKRVKAALDYEQALGYCKDGIGLLSERCWQEQRDLTFDLHRERFELESLCGHAEEAKGLFALLLEKAQTDLEALSVYQFQILAYARENQAQKSIELGFQALKQFGMHQSLKSDRRSLLAAFVNVRRQLTQKRAPQLAMLPDATDPKVIAQMEILWAMAVVMLVVDYNKMIRFILKILELTLHHGWAAPSGTAFIMYGNLVAQYGEYELSAAYGQLGVKARAVNGQGLFSYTANIMPFVSPLREVNESFAAVLQRAQEAGDLRIFANGLIMKIHAMIGSGLPLEEVQAELQNGLQTVQIGQSAWSVQALQILLGLVRHLRGFGTGTADLGHDGFDEEQYRRLLSESRTSGQVQPLNYSYGKFLLLFLAGDYEQAERMAEEIERGKMFPRGHFVEVHFFHLYALTLLMRSDRPDWKLFRRLQKRVKAAARRCPENYLHKVWLLEAEVARIRGHRQRAMDLYDQAVNRALERQFWNDEGIAHERAANYYLSIGKTAIARTYLQAARQAFLKWGALSKAQQMKAQYPHLVDEDTASSPRSDNVDHLTVIKAAQAVSGEIVLENLNQKMMGILLENAGAQLGTMLFEQDGQWTAHDERVEVSQAVVQYVARTGESVVLHDACREGLFRNDLSLRVRRVKSLLCTPIRHQAKQVGLLYLENNVTTHAFTSERLELLQLLSTQFAISIENARLYANLEEQVRMRTADLEEANRQLENSIQETARAWSDVAVWEERTRIAHELHDVIGHTLTTTILQVESCKRLATKDLDKALQTMDLIQDNLRNGLQEVRVSVRMLKDNISQMETGQALEKLLLDTQAKLGLEIEYRIDPLPTLDAKLRRTLYLALQEGLTNGVRHGNCSRFHFRLSHREGSVHFELRDNGVGFAENVFGFGLTMMREQVERMGGSHEILSSPGNGCTLRLTLPVS